jgi:hypothetical protein
LALWSEELLVGAYISLYWHFGSTALSPFLSQPSYVEFVRKTWLLLSMLLSSHFSLSGEKPASTGVSHSMLFSVFSILVFPEKNLHLLDTFNLPCKNI